MENSDPVADANVRHLEGWVRAMDDSAEFKAARRTMAKHLREDEGLRQTYEANVAMLLHDRHGITDHDKRNAAAKDILHLVFES